MRKIAWVLLAVVFLAACRKNKKEKNSEGVGTLTSADYRKCSCCGGVFLTIDNVAGQYLIHELPSMTMEELQNLNFPRRIEFEYRDDGTCAGNNVLEITSYTLLP